MPVFGRAMLLSLTVAGILPLPTVASACPFCDAGPSGRNEVHAAIFDGGFWFNLVAVALPFVLGLALALVIHGAPPAWKGPLPGKEPFNGRA